MTESEATERTWEPGLESRLAYLRSLLASGEDDHLEVAVDDLPVACRVGMDSSGSIWIRLSADRASVAVDDRSAAVRFDVTQRGYRVVVAPTAPLSAAVHLLEEILQLVRGGHPPGDAGRAALQNWRDLLARPAGSPMSEDALVGLFGELEVLTSVLGAGGGLDSWTGWNRDHADFRLPGLVIEVKSTTSANYRRVRINGLGQLADPEDGSELVLVLRRLEASPDGLSVPDLTDRIVSLGASRSVLLDRLSRVNYSEEHRSQYENVRFVSQELVLRRIDDSHPRLTAAMLAGVDLSSIDKVDYELNLNNSHADDLDSDLDTIITRRLSARS